jgi:hypothetical protein
MFTNLGDICILLDVEDSSTSLRNQFVSIYANPSFPLLSHTQHSTIKCFSKWDTESISIARIEEINPIQRISNKTLDYSVIMNLYRKNSLALQIPFFLNYSRNQIKERT